MSGIDTAVYHKLKILGDKQYLICYRFKLDQSQGNAPTGNYTQTSRLHAQRNNLPRNADVQLKRAQRRERRKFYTVLIPNDLYKNIDYLTSCLQTNLKS